MTCRDTHISCLIKLARQRCAARSQAAKLALLQTAINSNCLGLGQKDVASNFVDHEILPWSGGEEPAIFGFRPTADNDNTFMPSP